MPFQRFGRSLRFGLLVDNLFNAHYCSDGYGGSWLEGSTLADRQAWACFFPQATVNFLANVTFRF